MLGFIFTRHVNSEKTNNYWIQCYKHIRDLYPDNIIMIIDDNSNYEFIHNNNVVLTNCFIIQSEFPGRGELLPYYYFYKYKLFDTAFICHDSLFIRKNINIDNIHKVQFLWDIPHSFNNPITQTKLLSYLNHSEELIKFYYQNNKWKGCFGTMSIIQYDFLKLIAEKYNFFTLLHHIQCREDRSDLERVFASVVTYENQDSNLPISIEGSIYSFGWGYLFHEYMNDIQNNTVRDKPFIKVWSGR